MNTDSLDERISNAFFERLETETEVPLIISNTLKEDMTQTSFGDEDDIVETAIEAYKK